MSNHLCPGFHKSVLLPCLWRFLWNGKWMLSSYITKKNWFIVKWVSYTKIQVACLYIFSCRRRNRLGSSESIVYALFYCYVSIKCKLWFMYCLLDVTPEKFPVCLAKISDRHAFQHVERNLLDLNTAIYFITKSLLVFLDLAATGGFLTVDQLCFFISSSMPCQSDGMFVSIYKNY